MAVQKRLLFDDSDIPGEIQHLANELVRIRPHRPPRLTGVYFIVWQGEVIYVGATRNAHSRLEYYERRRKQGRLDFDQMLLLEIDTSSMSELKRIESAVISWLCPALNRAASQAMTPEERMEVLRDGIIGNDHAETQDPVSIKLPSCRMHTGFVNLGAETHEK